ncbi:Egg cell-secreted protein 1.4 [Acorus gramineus]|uniref:Egg cell-secreted protein 1.4 n=1 Tax=Acorus gramineus TaxID=55184 RepID=A0AAV9BH95_ACOGR|nr:Egg cell-secreted protein 1.4 [Acorus gramineus]
MPDLTKLSLPFFLFLLLLSPCARAARPGPRSARVDSASSLSARLHADDGAGTGGAMECWESLVELRACTGEVILFFLNGETHLGEPCCGAIGYIERHCWPSMLTSIGFTPEEGDLLLGYCDSDSSAAPPTTGKTNVAHE